MCTRIAPRLVNIHEGRSACTALRSSHHIVSKSCVTDAIKPGSQLSAVRTTKVGKGMHELYVSFVTINGPNPTPLPDTVNTSVFVFLQQRGCPIHSRPPSFQEYILVMFTHRDCKKVNPWYNESRDSYLQCIRRWILRPRISAFTCVGRLGG